MDVQKDLGKRIVEAARLAAALHLQLRCRPGDFGGAETCIGSDGGASKGVDAAPVGFRSFAGGAGASDIVPDQRALGLGAAWSRAVAARLMAEREAA